ncbi:MAG: glycosyltransferase [Paludibacteraceae bacterium]|nr:glycosyltransferase [Paludibacteraceae bacterium]
MGIILSIIVPVYNVNKYLCKCLDSLLCQDLDIKTYEIIVVDDGSTDDSGIIADNYAQKFSNIKVIHKQNGGLSDARNAGILYSKGKYIQFVDSDDYLECNTLKGLIDIMENENLDILRFNYKKVNENYEIITHGAEAVNLGDYSNKVCNGITFLNERLWYACFAVQFIIEGEILRKQANLFHKGIFYEDAEWTPRIVIQAGRITSTDKIVYNYLIRSNSISRDINRDISRKRLNDKLFVIDSIIKTSSYVTDKRWFKWMVSQMAYTLLGKVAAELYDEKDLYIQELKRRGVFPLTIKNCSRLIMLKMHIINISPALFCMIIKICR